MLHVTCDVIGIQCAMPFFEIQDGRHAFCTLSKFVLENVRNRAKNGFSNTNSAKYKEFE